MAQKNDWLDGLEGFARRDFAEKRVRQALGGVEHNVTWFIYTLPNGRFAPVVVARGDGWMDYRGLAEKGIGIM